MTTAAVMQQPQQQINGIKGNKNGKYDICFLKEFKLTAYTWTPDICCLINWVIASCPGLCKNLVDIFLSL